MPKSLRQQPAKSIRADGIGKRLTLLLRHDDDKIAGAQFLYGQIQHDPCAECCVQAKINGLIVRQLPGQQSAVNAESGCTAAHKNKTRFIAFRGQQGTLGGQFPTNVLPYCAGRAKPHTVRSNGMAIKTQSILVNSFFMAGSELK